MSQDQRSTLMLIVSIVFFLYAIFWSLAPYQNINLPARFILDVSDWPIDSLSKSLDKNTMWLSSIGAGLLAAVSIFLGGIIAPAIKRGDRTVVRFTIIAMVVWYLIDSVGSMAAGVSSNVFFNTVYLFLVLFPLVIPRSKKG